MPSAQGVVKSNGGKIIGTFHINGAPRYLAVDVNPRSRQGFECLEATLSYDSTAQLLGDCKWSGTIGMGDLKMNFDGGFNIAGQVNVPLRSTAQTNGTGKWDTVKSTISNIPANPFRYNATVDRSKEERERELIQRGFPIIVIFGQTGTGKSSFINLLTSERQTLAVGEGLQSCTIDVSVIEVCIAGQPVVIIDTPGIDDTRDGVKEADVLKSIADRLHIIAQLGVHVTGVLFLHHICDNKFSQTTNRVSNMLKTLCGEAAMNQLMLCTTMWDRVPEDEADKRFEELCKTVAWKEMILGGASMATFSNASSNAKADAEEIVMRLIKNARPVELAIQDEMKNQKLKVAQTAAGKILAEGQEKQAESDRSVEDLFERQRKEGEARMQEAIRAEKLKIERLRDLERKQRRVRVEQLRQERKKAKRDMKERMNQLRKENEASMATVQKELQRRKREVARLNQQGETDPDRLKGETDDVLRLQARLRDVQRNGKDKVRAAKNAYDEEVGELKKQTNELRGMDKVAAKQLEQERKSAERVKKETENAARKDAAVEAEVATVQRRPSFFKLPSTSTVTDEVLLPFLSPRRIATSSHSTHF